MSTIKLARDSLASRLPRLLRPTRSVEVRVVVGGVEEDRFVASRPDTLARALKPIVVHLEDRVGQVDLTAVEAGPWPWSATRRVPLAAGLDEAFRYLVEWR